MSEVKPWPYPMFSPDEVIDMRAALMAEGFSAKDVQDLPLRDLWELYRETAKVTP